MIYTETIRSYPYMKKDGIAEEFHISPQTVRNRLKEIEQEVKKGRYSDHAVIQDGNILLINVLVFLDYLTYRRQLMNKNLRKNVPAFRPDILMRDMGWSNRVVTAEE